MAKYDVTHSCGHEVTVDLVGKESERQWRIRNMEQECCEACAAERAAAKNLEYGLPDLIGSPAQIAWANQIRIGCFEWYEQNLYKNQDKLGAAFEEELIIYRHFKENSRSAKFWIDNRHFSPDVLYKQHRKKYMEEIERKLTDVRERDDAFAKAAKAEATLRPENPCTDMITEIKVDGEERNGTVSLYSEKDETFRLLVKKYGYAWTDRAWRLSVGFRNGTVEDRAAEIANALLRSGFPVMIMDEKIREKAVDGSFKPEQKKWALISADKKMISLYFDRDDTIYSAARKLPGSQWNKLCGSVDVPMHNAEAVLDFSDAYGFEISPGCKRAIDAWIAEKEAALVVRPAKPEIMPNQNKGIAGILDSSREVLPDLRDEDELEKD